MASTPSASSRTRSASNGRGYLAKSSVGPNCAGLTKRLTITRWFSRRARATSRSWPAWSAPTVGTKPISSPAFRQATACSCMAIADSIRSGLAGGVFVLRGGEGAVAHVLVELAGGRLDGIAEFCVLADEFGHVIGRQPEDVLDDEHLGVAVWPGADADRGNGQRFGHSLAQGARDTLEHDGERSRLFEGLRVVEDLLRCFIAATLHPVPAELVDKGGRQAQMRHHRNAHGGELPGVLDDPPATLHLHCLDACFLHKAACVTNGVFRRRVVRHEWQI